MNFPKDPRANWKYILIVVLLATFVGGGVFYQWRMLKEETKISESETPKRVAEVPEEEREAIEDETADWKTYRNGEEVYEIKYFVGPRITESKNLLFYSKYKEELEIWVGGYQQFQRKTLEIFKLDLDLNTHQKIIEVKQEGITSRSIFAEKRENYIIVFGLGKTAQKEEIFELSGNLIKDFELPPNFDTTTPLVFSEDESLYAYTILHEYAGEDTEKIKEEEWGTVVIKNRKTGEERKLSLKEFKEKTGTKDYFAKFYLPELGYLESIGFRDNQNLYLTLQVGYPGPIPGYLFILNLKTKEIKEITSIRKEELLEGWEYNLNPQIGLAYGMKRGSIGIEGEFDSPPTELFIVDLDKDKYSTIVKEEKLLGGSYTMDKEGKYLVFNFSQPVISEYRTENLEVQLYNLQTKEIKSLGKLSENSFVRAILNDGKSIVFSDGYHDFYLFNISTNETKQILSKEYEYIDIWSK